MTLILKPSYLNKRVLGHLILGFDTVLMCEIVVKYHCSSRGVCVYVLVFRSPPGCALIGACALIKTNTVCTLFQVDEQEDMIEIKREALIISL